MELFVAKNLLCTALRLTIPFACNKILIKREELLVYRERDNQRRTGHYEITKIEDKLVYINRNSTSVQFLITSEILTGERNIFVLFYIKLSI